MRQIYTQSRNKFRIDEAIIYCEGSVVNTEYTRIKYYITSSMRHLHTQI